MIIIIVCDTAYIEKIGTENDVISKTRGINDKRRMFVNDNVLIEFREPGFFKGHKCCGFVAPVSKTICRSLKEESGV